METTTDVLMPYIVRTHNEIWESSSFQALTVLRTYFVSTAYNIINSDEVSKEQKKLTSRRLELFNKYLNESLNKTETR